MRVWAAHGVFAGILLASLAVQRRDTDARYDDASLLEPSILRIASSHGLTLQGYRAMGGNMPPALIFEAPGCVRPVQVNPLLSSFEEVSLMDDAPGQGYARRYIYFGASWDRPKPWAVFVQRMKYRALAMFGLSGYVPSKYLLRIEAPKNCEPARNIDWSSVWSRKYLAAAPTTAKSNSERTIQ
jgi:hypothetical protein